MFRVSFSNQDDSRLQSSWISTHFLNFHKFVFPPSLPPPITTARILELPRTVCSWCLTHSALRRSCSTLPAVCISCVGGAHFYTPALLLSQHLRVLACLTFSPPPRLQELNFEVKVYNNYKKGQVLDIIDQGGHPAVQSVVSVISLL